MTTGTGYRWQDADRLFDEALRLPPPQRAGWVEAHCGDDPALRRQVEALLQADAAATGFLEIDGVRLAGPLIDPPEAEAAGRAIGPYRVVRELARGGMGVVYLAERADGGFEQRVALKLIKRGMDSDRIHRRFLAERQILARLSHPNIARLLDGGVTAEGQPYFAIEYVHGRTILDHCESHRLGIDERLRLFLHVCEAVRYAHGNLVVHRDLKPGNILVTEDGQVKLLDFGIAKLLTDGQEDGGDEGPDGLVTLTGDRVLTPEYAAPEQVLGNAVTTATDIYALGAVLYELLTGRRAHHVDRRTPTEIVRAVIETQPAAPSVVAPAERRRALRGDLDVIVLTALKKEPARRYQTVDRLAGDITRHLGGFPVTARPETLRYRAAKFAGRHRIAVAAWSAVALSLLIGLAGTIWQGQVAARQARVAGAEAAKQRAVRDFLVRLFRSATPGHTLGREPSARDLLEEGRHQLDTALAAQPEVRAELLEVVASAYGALGLAPQADTLFEQAVALARTLPDQGGRTLPTALTDWAGNLLVQSKFDRAGALLREAIALRRTRNPDDPDLAQPLRSLGRVHTYTGNRDSATALLREALAIDLRHHGPESWQVANGFDDLGYELLRQRNLAGADSAIGAALTVWRRLLPADHPSLLWTLGNLSAVRRAQGDLAEAERLLKEVVAGQQRIYPHGHSELAHSIGWLGGLLAEQGRWAEAESITAPMVALHRPLLGPDNSHVAMLLENLADYRYRLGRLAEAERDRREVTEIWQRAHGGEDRMTLASMDKLAVDLREQRRFAEAESLFRQTLAVRTRHPGDPHPDLAGNLLELGILERMRGRPAEAERLLRDALEANRAGPSDSLETTRVLRELGVVLIERGKAKEAEPLLREAFRGLAGRADYLGVTERRETARQLAEMYRRMGNAAESRRWGAVAGS